MTDELVASQSRISRRTVIGDACIVAGAAALSGCTVYDTSVDPRTEAATATMAPGTKITATADVPVGGGVVVKAGKVVVTQPTQGEFKGFTAVCTHAGCVVKEVAGGTINCPCHGSKFSITDGSVVAGPAKQPLGGARIAVEGTEIVSA